MTATRACAAAMAVAVLAALPARAAAPAGLRAGFAVVDITPELKVGKPVWMAGFRQGRSAAGVHDPLHARCAVFASANTRVALVAVDLIGYFRDEVERVRAKLKADGVPVDHVLVASTHTHAGPDTIGIWGASRQATGVDPAYMQRVVERIAAAVKQANDALEPVTLYAASGRTRGLTKDFRKPEVLDEELGVLQARQNGDPVFTIVQWASHPEALGKKNRLITADFCASVVATVEKETGAPAAYFNGAIGGLMTPLEVPVRDPKTGKPAPPETFRHAELIGREVARAALELARAAKRCARTDLTVRTKVVDVPLANALYKAGLTVGVLKRAVYRNGKPILPVLTAVASSEIRTEVGMWRIGDVEIAAIPGELYPELSMGRFQEPREPGADFVDAPREPHVRGLLTGPHRWVIGLANDEIGYIMPKSQWDAAAPFCYGRDKPQYGEVNSVGPEAGPRVMQALEELVDRR